MVWSHRSKLASLKNCTSIKEECCRAVISFYSHICCCKKIMYVQIVFMQFSYNLSATAYAGIKRLQHGSILLWSMYNFLMMLTCFYAIIPFPKFSSSSCKRNKNVYSTVRSLSLFVLHNRSFSFHSIRNQFWLRKQWIWMTCAKSAATTPPDCASISNSLVFQLKLI